MTVQINLRPGLYELVADTMRSALSAKTHSETRDTAGDSGQRRQFVQDMLTRNPDAFSNELDVQHMMHCFPGRF